MSGQQEVARWVGSSSAIAAIVVDPNLTLLAASIDSGPPPPDSFMPPPLTLPLPPPHVPQAGGL